MFFHTRQIFLVSHNNQLAFTEASFSCGLWSEQDKTADCLEDSLTLDDAILIDQNGGHHPVSNPCRQQQVLLGAARQKP